jgi:hypothetical protein
MRGNLILFYFILFSYFFLPQGILLEAYFCKQEYDTEIDGLH